MGSAALEEQVAMGDLNKEVAQGRRAAVCNGELIPEFNCAGQEFLELFPPQGDLLPFLLLADEVARQHCVTLVLAHCN